MFTEVVTRRGPSCMKDVAFPLFDPCPVWISGFCTQKSSSTFTRLGLGGRIRDLARRPSQKLPNKTKKRRFGGWSCAQCAQWRSQPGECQSDFCIIFLQYLSATFGKNIGDFSILWKCFFLDGRFLFSYIRPTKKLIVKKKVCNV